MPRASAAAAPSYALNLSAAGPTTIAGSGAACKSIFVTGAELGHGEQGVVFDIPSAYTNRAGTNWSVVMKVSDFGPVATRAATQAKWVEEVKISKQLGDMEAGEGLRVAPKIISAWICGGKGYIIMERMKSDLRKVKAEDGARVGEKVTMAGQEIQKNHIDNTPFDIQDDYIVLLEHMIDNGFVHMDNHPGNLGVLTYTDGDHGVLFDFGFTRKYADLNNNDKLYALAFSIAQILEHTPLDELSGSFMFMIFVNIMLQAELPAARRYEWGSRTPQVNDKDFKDFMTAHKLRRVTDSVLPIATPPGMNHPEFYVGAKLYCYFLMFKQPQRYDWVDYEKIYTIRQSLPLTLGTDYVAPAAAAVAKTPKRAAAPKKVLRGKRKEVVIENAPARVTRRGARAAAAAAAEEDISVPSISAKVARVRSRAREYAAADAGIAARAKLSKKRGGRRGCGFTRRHR